MRVEAKKPPPKSTSKRSDWLLLTICVLGIYGTFLTWAVLQERISTTAYGADERVFRANHITSGTQSALACIAGFGFSRFSSSQRISAVPRSWPVLRSYLIVAVCQTLSSAFAYQSLRYVDYLTLLLAKSCKLLPVMAVHLVLYRRRFPLYKYLVVGLISIGVSLFSIYQTSNSNSRARKAETKGFLLLGANLLLDGVYNTTQDEMFRRFPSQVTGPHMMAVLNFLTALLEAGSFIWSPQQRADALWFFQHHPQVFRDIFLYGLCGALGQIFVFLTLERFGSLVLVTTTVTRKMISMLLSVVMFNHRLSPFQWIGVALVFVGIVGETVVKVRR